MFYCQTLRTQNILPEGKMCLGENSVLAFASAFFFPFPLPT